MPNVLKTIIEYAPAGKSDAPTLTPEQAARGEQWVLHGIGPQGHIYTLVAPTLVRATVLPHPKGAFGDPLEGYVGQEVTMLDRHTALFPDGRVLECWPGRIQIVPGTDPARVAELFAGRAGKAVVQTYRGDGGAL